MRRFKMLLLAMVLFAGSFIYGCTVKFSGNCGRLSDEERAMLSDAIATRVVELQQQKQSQAPEVQK